MASSSSSKDKHNFQCVTEASLELIKLPLKDILRSQIKPENLFLKIKSSLLLSGRSKLRPDQLNLCYFPPPLLPDFSKFDVTLLYTLIRNLCPGLEPTRGWGNEPGPNDTKIGDDIERLRLFRNKNYAHLNSATIPDDTFEDLWKTLKAVLSRLKSHSGCGVDYEQELIEIKRSHFRYETWEDYRKLWNVYLEIEKEANERDIRIKGEEQVICGYTVEFKAEVKQADSFFSPIKWQRRKGQFVEIIDTTLEKYSGSTDTRLIIPSVCKEDALVYQASLSDGNNQTLYSNAINLHVLGEKPVLNELEVTTEDKGIIIHYSFEVSKNSPPVRDITWSKNAQPMYIIDEKFSGGSLHDIRLVIKSPSEDDKGNYSCTVTNDVGSQTKHIVLDIPSVTLSVDSTFRYGSTAIVKANVCSTPLPERVNWQKSNDRISFHSINITKRKYDGSNDMPERPKLVISNISFRDKLYYRLVVSNKIGDGKSGTVYINVTGSRPNVTTSEHTNIKKRSIKLVGNVFVYEDSPDIIDVFWTKNEEKVESEERTRINKPTLTLKKISSEDAGQYQLTATNAIGSTTSNVIVLGKPDIFFERPVMKTDGSQWFPVTIQAIPAPFSVVWSAKKSDGEWFIPVDIDTCDFQRTTNAFPHPMLVVKGEQMENYTYQLEVENFIGRTIKKTPGRKFFKKKNAGIRFVRLSKYLAENFPADKLLNLKYILGASGKVTNRNSLRDADTVLKCFIVLQEENIFTQQDVIFMQFLFKELECKELYEKCIQYAQEQEALCFFEKSPDNGYQNVKFHIQGNLTDYSKNQIENITDEVAAMIECEDGDILLNGVMESASFLLVLSIKESYTHRLFILGKQDRLKLKKLNIDYIIVDKETICLDSQNDNPVKKLCEEKDAGLEFSKLSHILAKQFPKEKLQHLKDVLLASGKVGDWYSIKTADSALKCFAVLQDEVLFTRYNLLFMQFLLKETSCDTLSRKCIQFALETAREEVNILTHDQGLPPTSHLRIGRISVLLEIGILQDKMVDVLVCNGPENLQLKNGELAESLLEAAGPGLQTECDQKYPQGIQYGDLAITGGHNMKCQFLYLGSIPKWETLGTHTPLEILLEFVTKCLEEGNKHKSTKTMAFPTLGTGSLNYPPDKVAEVFTKCIQNFNQKYPKTELTLISIVVNNHRKKREIFEQAFFSALKWSNQTRSSQWTTKSTGFYIFVYGEKRI